MTESGFSRRAVLAALVGIPLSTTLLTGSRHGPNKVGTGADLFAVDQPHMREALTHLREARKHLAMARPDKGGHRVEALRACDEAIHHTEEGIRFDRTH